MSLLDVLSKRPSPRPVRSRAEFAQRLGQMSHATAVQRRVDDLDRILALTKRPPLDLDSPEAARIAQAMTVRLRRAEVPPCDCAARGVPCPRVLKPVQGWGLEEASKLGGLLGAIGVGHGKTLMDLLAPMVVPNCKTAVLLAPAQLIPPLLGHWVGFYQRHGWTLPDIADSNFRDFTKPVLHIISYNKLGHPDHAGLLDSIRPDLIIADECQMLKNRQAAVTARVLNYFVANPTTRMCAWSGSLLKRSLMDFAHLALMTLGEGAPVPRLWAMVEDWAMYLDPNDLVHSVPAGHPLLALSNGERKVKLVRAGFNRRLVETPGVVITPGKSTNIPIYFRPRDVDVPPDVQDAFRMLNEKGMRPDGQVFNERLMLAKCARELACGFFYRWVFPYGEPDELIKEWIDVRKAYVAELRTILVHRAPYLDSPKMCFAAAKRYHEKTGEGPTWKSMWWPAWNDIKDRVRHETEPVWINTFLAENAAEWALKHNGVVWYAHSVFGEKVAEISGLRLFGPGKKSAVSIEQEGGGKSIVASIYAHATGKNLQMFSEQLVANPPSDGGMWEQLLGRSDRPGQKSDHINVYVYRHVEQMVKAVDRAYSLADYIEAMLTTPQRLTATRPLSAKSA